MSSCRGCDDLQDPDPHAVYCVIDNKCKYTNYVWLGLWVNMTKFCNKIIINEFSSKFQITILRDTIFMVSLINVENVSRNRGSASCSSSPLKKDSIGLGFLGRRDQMNHSHPFHIYVLLMFLHAFCKLRFLCSGC